MPTSPSPFDEQVLLALYSNTHPENSLLNFQIALFGEQSYGAGWAGSWQKAPLYEGFADNRYPKVDFALGRLKKAGYVERLADPTRIGEWGHWRCTEFGREHCDQCPPHMHQSPGF